MTEETTLTICAECRDIIEDGDEYRPYGEPICLDCAIVWENDRYGDDEVCGCCGRSPEQCWKEQAR